MHHILCVILHFLSLPILVKSWSLSFSIIDPSSFLPQLPLDMSLFPRKMINVPIATLLDVELHNLATSYVVKTGLLCSMLLNCSPNG